MPLNHKKWFNMELELTTTYEDWTIKAQFLIWFCIIYSKVTQCCQKRFGKRAIRFKFYFLQILNLQLRSLIADHGDRYKRKRCSAIGASALICKRLLSDLCGSNRWDRPQFDIRDIRSDISLSCRDGTEKHCNVFDPAPLVHSENDRDQHIEAGSRKTRSAFSTVIPEDSFKVLSVLGDFNIEGLYY